MDNKAYRQYDLDKIRNENNNLHLKKPFPFQSEAHDKMTKLFDFKDQSYKAGLVVLPTGAGKTFTTVYWLYNHIIPRNTKVLWLAQTFHLLDQAFKDFEENLSIIPSSRKFLNIRKISSQPDHDKSTSILPDDDILVMSVQTAISNFKTDTTKTDGSMFESKFREFLKSCSQNGLFIVLDEAHHAPAYGCRHLLTGIREVIPNTYLVGLTATPYRTDKHSMGWFGKIFPDGRIYEADRQKLIIQKYLAKPIFEEMPTGYELKIRQSQEMYKRLVIEHKDLPEEIIEDLTNNVPRNDYIIETYCKNKGKYGKTIIFADKFHQCIYFKEKLKERGIDAEAVFSHTEKIQFDAAKQNEVIITSNKEKIDKFRKSDGGVLINIRMLTEGTDVPDIKTVFLTRQTNSPVLFTQMAGRALRGQKMGGDKDEANIVTFIDNWKDKWDIFVDPEFTLIQPLEDTKPTYSHYAIEYVSLYLIEKITKRIEAGLRFDPKPFLRHIPIGWYLCRYSTGQEKADEQKNASDEIQSLEELVIVYDTEKEAYEKFMSDLLNNEEQLDSEWSKEIQRSELMVNQARTWKRHYFSPSQDRTTIDTQIKNKAESVLKSTLKPEPKTVEVDEYFDLNIISRKEADLINIARHIGQNGYKPQFISFPDRKNYDMDKLAKEYSNIKVRQTATMGEINRDKHEYLKFKFYQNGSLWGSLFNNNFDRFLNEFQSALEKITYNDQYLNG